jgi:acetate kinase
VKILVINCGSSSIKYQLYEMPGKAILAKGMLEKIGEGESVLTHRRGDEKFTFAFRAPDHQAGMAKVLAALTDAKHGVIPSVAEIGAVGHRVVHGAECYSGSVVIDDEVIAAIDACGDLAPLHNPPNLVGIRAMQAALPGVKMAAVFDTAFHQTLAPEAYLYAIPYEIYEKYRVRKYGFHGTSHAYVSRRAAEILGKKPEEVNVITCHLGNGCSMAAVRGGKSVDTTMGLTPLSGVAMGTRSGDIDPAIIFYLMTKPEYKDFKSIDTLLNKKSGLLGISGLSNDMRDCTEAAKAGNARAQLAVDIFCHRVRSGRGQYMAALGRVDALVFTGGIGENAHYARGKILADLSALGIALDADKNQKAVGGFCGDISAGGPVKVLVIPTDEEGFIAGETYRLVAP